MLMDSNSNSNSSTITTISSIMMMTLLMYSSSAVHLTLDKDRAQQRSSSFVVYITVNIAKAYVDTTFHVAEPCIVVYRALVHMQFSLS
jgi:hypothetical protein